jgi:sugar fermentation stimulation protein A
MKFESPLIYGKIIKRYKRFLADVLLDNGELITAHTANTGSMTTCWEPGWKVALSYHDNPKRKLKYSLEMTHNNRTWIGVNTSVPNKLGKESILAHEIPELDGYEIVRSEVKIGKSRIDLKLENHPGFADCFVEIKNVTLWSVGEIALFPDSVTTRGQKHLQELTELKIAGTRAAMLYIVQRGDVNSFSPAEKIDPEYARLLRVAVDNGVEVYCYQYDVTPTQIKLLKRLEVIL